MVRFTLDEPKLPLNQVDWTCNCRSHGRIQRLEELLVVERWSVERTPPPHLFTVQLTLEAIHAVIFIVCLFGFPETKWHRVHPNDVVAPVPATHSQSSEELKERSAGLTSSEIEKVDTEVAASGPMDLSKQATAMRDPYLGKGKPVKGQFGIYHPSPNPLKSVIMDIWIPWKMFAFPIVEFASFVVSWSASAFLTLNLTQSQVFAAPPYNFPPQSVGFTNFAVFVGSLIGLFTAGPLSDSVRALPSLVRSRPFGKANGNVRYLHV